MVFSRHHKAPRKKQVDTFFHCFQTSRLNRIKEKANQYRQVDTSFKQSGIHSNKSLITTLQSSCLFYLRFIKEYGYREKIQI